MTSHPHAAAAPAASDRDIQREHLFVALALATKRLIEIDSVADGAELIGACIAVLKRESESEAAEAAEAASRYANALLVILSEPWTWGTSTGGRTGNEVSTFARCPGCRSSTFAEDGVHEGIRPCPWLLAARTLGAM